MDFQVGIYLIRAGLNRIVCGSRSSRVTPKSMEVLVCLAKRQGEAVSKSELFEEVWPGTHVTDDALTKCIGELRRILHGKTGEPPIIETISKRGYRIAAPIIWDTNVKNKAAEAPGTEPGKGTGDPIEVGVEAYHWRSSRSLMVAGALLLTLGILVTASLRPFLGMGVSQTRIQSIAVLPLADLSGNPD